MAYDLLLAQRVRDLLPEDPELSEKKMFGGLVFLLSGKMVVGVAGDELMVRVGKPGYDAALTRPHARPMDFTGKPLTGYVYVGPAGLADDAALLDWVEEAIGFVRTHVLGGAGSS